MEATLDRPSRVQSSPPIVIPLSQNHANSLSFYSWTCRTAILSKFIRSRSAAASRPRRACFSSRYGSTAVEGLLVALGNLTSALMACSTTSVGSQTSVFSFLVMFPKRRCIQVLMVSFALLHLFMSFLRNRIFVVFASGVGMLFVVFGAFSFPLFVIEIAGFPSRTRIRREKRVYLCIGIFSPPPTNFSADELPAFLPLQDGLNLR